jgi:hypothetical protein
LLWGRLREENLSSANKIVPFFFFNGEQEGKTDPVWELVPVRGGRYKERANVVEMLCTHVCKQKK